MNNCFRRALFWNGAVLAYPKRKAIEARGGGAVS